jgi:hypothetical protein
VAEPAVIEQHYIYPFSSTLTDRPGRPQLALASSHAPVAERLFFQGTLQEPELAAALLLATSEVALRRYYVPSAMVARILRAADPVVTAAGGRLRWESFSQCCGVYARADLLPAMLSATTFGKGTTNVDFNPPMRAALTRIRKSDGLELEVTPQRVAIESHRGGAVEHKVKLPLRWLKGFAEVQALAADLSLAMTIDGVEARRFLAALPAQVRAQERSWLIATGTGVRVSQQPAPEAVSASGLGRLAVMNPLARHASTLRIYGSRHGTSGFELDFGPARFLLILSAAPARGFSGEGQLLAALACEGRMKRFRVAGLSSPGRAI